MNDSPLSGERGLMELSNREKKWLVALADEKKTAKSQKASEKCWAIGVILVAISGLLTVLEFLDLFRGAGLDTERLLFATLMFVMGSFLWGSYRLQVFLYKLAKRLKEVDPASFE